MKEGEERTYTFFVNPVSGRGGWYRLVKRIRSFCFRNGCIPEFYFTGDDDKIREVLDQKEKEGAHVIFAVGGDGTVNQMARLLVGRDLVLGIIPAGSGNGLAGHLGIPRQPRKALSVLKDPQVTTMDYASINGIPFFTTAGVGFDAEVTQRFNKGQRRGLLGYIESILKVVQNYKSETYKLEYDGQEKVVNAFLVTFANASEYGAGAYIAPDADTSDGYLDVSVLKPFPLTAVPGLVLRLFTKKIHRSKYVETLRVRNLRVIKDRPGNIHFDGEGHSHNGEIEINTIPRKLKVMTRRSAKEDR